MVFDVLRQATKRRSEQEIAGTSKKKEQYFQKFL